MSAIPIEIAQAKVLEFVRLLDKHEPTGNTKHYVDGMLLKNVYGLAICKYQDEPGFYLFYCDEHWVEQTDTYHDSIQEAKNQAEFEFHGTITDWQHI